jgi:diadenosine tetraphosphate (Ap4A) HIT family hydrolase
MDKQKPWTDKVKELSTEYVEVFRDKYPVTDGHLLFVPVDTYYLYIEEALTYAYEVGRQKVLDKEFEAFNIGMNCGEEAGQTVGWPHIHLIPRRKGDMDDPRGGVRGVIPDKQKY